MREPWSRLGRGKLYAGVQGCPRAKGLADEIATLLAPPLPKPKAKAPADHGALLTQIAAWRIE